VQDFLTPVMQVYITDEAEADLEEIADYIALDNPTRAVSFAQELRARAMLLGDMPRAAPSRPDLGKGLRAAVHAPCLIVFRIRRQCVEVLRIIHGA
jgi:plasmid stabilization system protein ParE